MNKPKNTVIDDQGSAIMRHAPTVEFKLGLKREHLDDFVAR